MHINVHCKLHTAIIQVTDKANGPLVTCKWLLLSGFMIKIKDFKFFKLCFIWLCRSVDPKVSFPLCCLFCCMFETKLKKKITPISQINLSWRKLRKPQ